MKNKFLNFCLIVSKYSFIVLVSFFSISNIFFTVSQSDDVKVINNYNFGLTPLHIIVVFILFLLFIYLNKKDYLGIKDETYMVIFIVIVIALGTYWIFSNPRILVDYDDPYNCIETAKGILRNDYSVLGFKSYVNTYPHNLPLITYFSIIIKIFGEHNAITVINIINLCFCVIGYLYLYKITKRLFNNRKTTMNVISLMFLSLQLVFFSYYVYGNVMSISLSFISIYYLLKYLVNKKLFNFVISAITISLGVAAKNNVFIVLVAEVIYLVIETIKEKKCTSIVLALVMVASCLLTTTGVIKFWEYKAEYSYENKLPRICWIGYGLNYDENHPGAYLNDFESYHVQNGYVVEFTEERVKNFIKGTLSDFSNNPTLIPKFLGEKLLTAWTNPEYGVFTYGHIKENNTSKTNYNITNGELNNLINSMWDGSLSVVSIGLLFYICKRKKDISQQELILAIVFIGGFLFHLFWELASKYMYHYYLCLLPYAAHGLMLLFNKK